MTRNKAIMPKEMHKYRLAYNSDNNRGFVDLSKRVFLAVRLRNFAFQKCLEGILRPKIF